MGRGKSSKIDKFKEFPATGWGIIDQVINQSDRDGRKEFRLVGTMVCMVGWVGLFLFVRIRYDT